MELHSVNGGKISLFNLLFKLISAINFRINTASVHKFEMRSGIDHFAVMEDENPVDSLESIGAMGDYDGGHVRKYLMQSFP